MSTRFSSFSPFIPHADGSAEGLNGLADALSLYRGQANTLANAPVLGNPEARASHQEQMGALVEGLAQARSAQQRGDELSRPEYVQNSGALGALAMIAQSYVGGRIRKQADESASDYAARVFQEQQRQAQAASEAQARAQAESEQRAFQRSIDLEREKGRIRAEQPTDAVRTLRELQANPELAELDRTRRAAGAARTSITMPGQNAFDRELGKADAQTYVQLRNNAGQAQQALNQIGNVEEILSLQQTGKAQEALALAGQYFGTEAGANMQALRGAIQPLVLAQVKQLGTGAGITDADRKFIEAGMPGFGNDPRANERVIRIMRQSSEANINLFNEAETFRQQNGTLVGFNPAAVLRPAPSEAPPTSAPAVRATNPGTGEVMELRNGQWEKVQ